MEQPEVDDPERAVATASQRLAERPGDDAAHEARARALLTLGRLEEAEADAMDAVRLDPEEVRYRELLAEIQSRRGEHADAAAEYARLAQRDPRQVAWTVAEAAERIEGSDAAKAVEVARRAVRLEPGNFDAQLSLARGLIHLGDAAGALTAAKRASDLRAADRAGRETLADALWLAGHEADAFHEFRALAHEYSGDDCMRVVAKARSLYRAQAGWFGRLVAALPALFAVAFRRGWLEVR
ncbi:MAG: tetratricopeptide repeat protein [Chloroflexota bacterium]|nr:tetratricopeptide repeat protein [Chloroflexota bacterium]